MTQQAAKTGGEDSDFWYGYGIVTGSENGRRFIEHGGGMVGYFASMVGDPDLGIGVVALINGPGSPDSYTLAALDLLGAGGDAHAVDLPEISDPMRVDDATDFTGSYRIVDLEPSGGRPREVTVAADNDRLSLSFDNQRVELRPGGAGSFVTDDPAFDRFVLTFEREAERVVGFMHGEAFFVREGEPNPVFAMPPAEWLAYPGHYRSHNPWTPDFRVVLNRGQLWLHLPAEPDGLAMFQPLELLADGSFRCGEDERIPEFIHFDVVIDGKSQRANLALCDFYRVNAP